MKKNIDLKFTLGIDNLCQFESLVVSGPALPSSYILKYDINDYVTVTEYYLFLLLIAIINSIKWHIKQTVEDKAAVQCMGLL